MPPSAAAGYGKGTGYGEGTLHGKGKGDGNGTPHGKYQMRTTAMDWRPEMAVTTTENWRR
jgi:hypothetical protein